MKNTYEYNFDHKVVEFGYCDTHPIVTLKSFDVSIEVVLDKSTEMNKFRVNIRCDT